MSIVFIFSLELQRQTRGFPATMALGLLLMHANLRLLSRVLIVGCADRRRYASLQKFYGNITRKKSDRYEHGTVS